MPKFDVWLSKSNKPTIVKVKNDHESSVDNSVYIKTIISSTKSTASKQVQTQIKSGLIKYPEMKQTPVSFENNNDNLLEKNDWPIKKAIFTDYNGVLDDPDVKSNERDLCFKLPQEADPHKIYMLAQLAVKHDAYLVFTSENRLYGGDLYSTVFRCLLHCGIEKYVQFIDDNEDKLQKLLMANHTPVSSNRSSEIREEIKRSKYTHYVVFEDYHSIDKELNPFMTNPLVGLTEEHIQQADLVLST